MVRLPGTRRVKVYCDGLLSGTWFGIVVLLLCLEGLRAIVDIIVSSLFKNFVMSCSQPVAQSWERIEIRCGMMERMKEM